MAKVSELQTAAGSEFQSFSPLLQKPFFRYSILSCGEMEEALRL